MHRIFLSLVTTWLLSHPHTNLMTRPARICNSPQVIPGLRFVGWTLGDPSVSKSLLYFWLLFIHKTGPVETNPLQVICASSQGLWRTAFYGPPESRLFQMQVLRLGTLQFEALSLAQHWKRHGNKQRLAEASNILSGSRKPADSITHKERETQTGNRPCPPRSLSWIWSAWILRTQAVLQRTLLTSMFATQSRLESSFILDTQLFEAIQTLGKSHSNYTHVFLQEIVSHSKWW